MRILIAMFLSASSLMAQGPNIPGMRNPASLMMMHGVLYPTQVAGLKIWLSADSGVYSDAGVTLCNDGDKVQRWVDRSGNGNDVGQTDISLQPIYKTAKVNGLPVVNFYVALPFGKRLTNGLNFSFTNEASVIVAFWSTNQGIGSDGPWKLSSDSGQTEYLGIGGATAVSSNLRLQVASGFKTISLQTLTWVVHTALIDGIKNATGYLNSKKTATIANSDTNNYNAITVGAAATENFRGWIAELIAYNRKLKSGESYGVEMYLKRKYAIADPF